LCDGLPRQKGKKDRHEKRLWQKDRHDDPSFPKRPRRCLSFLLILFIDPGPKRLSFLLKRLSFLLNRGIDLHADAMHGVD
jgi:hypothetical protein